MNKRKGKKGRMNEEKMSGCGMGKRNEGKMEDK